jgi:TRAP-type C4-dicarboxylate transport system substrate-binding protein
VNRLQRNDPDKTGTLAGAARRALLIVALATALPAAAQQLNLRMHTFVPPVSGSYKSLLWWTQKVEKDSGGRIKITLFGSMQLGGSATDLYEQAKSGAVDIAWTLPGYTAGLFPVTSAFELPFIGADAHVVSPAFDTFAKKWAKEEWSAVHPIVFHSAGSGVIHTRDRKIAVLADFKGMKIRTPSRISTEALKALGAVPVPIPGLKVTEALMHNVVDGAVLPWSISLAVRTIDVAKFHTETTLHEPTLALIMNKKVYESLSPELKKVIDANSGAWLAEEFGRRWEADDQRGVAKAKSLGHTIVTVSAEEEARWRKATQPVYDAWVKEMNDKGLPGREMLADAERLVAQARAAAATKK